MFKLQNYFALFFFLPLLQSCGSDAHAESPCGTSILDVSISLIDSLNGQRIESADVVLSGDIYDHNTRELTNGEVALVYNFELGVYVFDNSLEDRELDQTDVIIYSIDSGYHYNVYQVVSNDNQCGSLEKEILLCPQGTLCR